MATTSEGAPGSAGALRTAGGTLQPPPLKADGSIDWSQVAEITIIATEDYHD